VRDGPCRIAACGTGNRIYRLEHGGPLRRQRCASLPRRRQLLRRDTRARRQELPDIGTVLTLARRIGRRMRGHNLRAADGEPRLDHAGKIRRAYVDDLRAQSFSASSASSIAAA
jgi:hypothetical protein